MTQKYKGRVDDQDDLLLLITQDGRVVDDDQMYLDVGAGLIRSEKMKMSMRAPDPIPLLEFPWVNQPPVQVGTVYAYDDDPPFILNDAYAQNRLLREVDQQVRTGRWHETSFLGRAVSSVRYWMCGAALLLLTVSVFLQPYCQPPDTQTVRQVDEAGEVRTIQVLDVPSLKR